MRIGKSKIGILLALSVLIASAGFMTVVESRCAMVDQSSGRMSCEAMGCCAAPVSIPQHQPFFQTTLRCNTTKIAGLPSTLISTPVLEKSNLRIAVTSHTIAFVSSPSEIRNPQSEILCSDLRVPLTLTPERYVLSSAFLL